MKFLKAATLAVGTEVTDGQILDRNSALLSQKATSLGLQMIEHRAVPDDRPLIYEALKALEKSADVIFVTGGLGPTSDDFTREVIADYFDLQLQFDEKSWQQIEESLTKRGIAVREIQKQQCYFPQGAQILFNPAGTANAFTIVSGKTKPVRILALPGPPHEIEAIWEDSLGLLLAGLVPNEQREELLTWDCLGKGESEIAELVEASLNESQLRIGYRVHLPYVEVKVWVPILNKQKFTASIQKLEATLSPWIVARGKQDLAFDFLNLAWANGGLQVFDGATFGFLSERFYQVLQNRKQLENTRPLQIETRLDRPTETPAGFGENRSGLRLTIVGNEQTQAWQVGFSGDAAQPMRWQSVKPIHRHGIFSERGRRYITEKAILMCLNDLKP